MRIKLLLLCLCCTLLSGTLHGQTVNASSCSVSDVLKAWASVISSTTVFSIPPGVCPWTSPVSLTVPSGSTSLTVQGQTVCTGSGAPGQNNLACTDNTVIVDDYASSNNSALLSITTGPASSSFRITGLTIQGGSGSIKYGVVSLYGSSQRLRVDHNDFNPSAYSPALGVVFMRLYGPQYGVIDHNLFTGMVSPYQEAINAYNGDSPNGDLAWAQPSGLGGPNFLFIEDNTFNSFGAVDDCFVGGRMVFRYNTVNHSNVQTHPTGGAGDWRGCLALELYQNAFNESNLTPEYNLYFLSSGTGVVWGNSAPAGYEAFISLHSMRRNSTTYAQAATPNGWGYCGTSFNGTGSPWDLNSNTTTGYQCLDQPGLGMGQPLSGQFPNKLNTKTNSAAWPDEAHEPGWIHGRRPPATALGFCSIRTPPPSSLIRIIIFGATLRVPRDARPSTGRRAWAAGPLPMPRRAACNMWGIGRPTCPCSTGAGRRTTG